MDEKGRPVKVTLHANVGRYIAGMERAAVRSQRPRFGRLTNWVPVLTWLTFTTSHDDAIARRGRRFFLLFRGRVLWRSHA